MSQAPEPNQPDAKPPLSEQIADIVVKVIKPGGVTVGGLGAFWFLFAESDVPKAIASSFIGVLLSYGARLLQPLHQRNQALLDQAGKAIDRRAAQLITKATGFEDRYLECQALECQAMRSEGTAQHSGIFTPLLKEVFVPLELVPNAIAPGFQRHPIFEQFATVKDIWQFLAEAQQEPMFRQLVVLAWGGYGKTTLLKHIAYLFGIQEQPPTVPKRIPILLVLRKYRNLLAQEQPPTLPDLITKHHVPSLPGASDLQVPDFWAKDILKRGLAIVLIDGFDEVAKAQRPAIARWINEQMRQYGRSIFIVTSRPKAYREQDAADRLELATVLWVKDFDKSQRKEFVEKWYQCQERYSHGGRTTPDVQQIATQAATDLLDQIETRQELKDLAKNPLLLNMIVTFHRRYPGAELPKRRVELYREICLLQLRDRPAARKLETLLTCCDAQVILQKLALVMMRNRWQQIERTKLLQGLTKILKQQGETIAAVDFLEQVVQISELLVEKELEEFEFTHLSFQEYLAATEIAQNQPEKVLYDYIYDDWWKPTILLYIAQIRNPTSLINTIYEREATDFAYICFQEISELRRIDPALREKLIALKQIVQTSQYATLEHYLKQGQWVKADQETYRLMITAIGKEEGQYFEPEEILNFPCDVLKAIDSLWVNYSNGKFGFSVQKQIYVECGAKLDGNYLSKEIWEKFGDRIGWRKDGEWQSYEEISNTPSFSSYRGFFPAGQVRGFYMGFWSFGIVFSSLAQRLVDCNIP